MKTTLPCPIDGCEFVAEHKKEIVAKRMLGVHKRYKHGIAGARAQLNGSARRTTLVRALPAVSPEISLEDLIRKIVAEFAFCPRCGKNIEKHLLATIALAKHEHTH